MWKNKRKTGMDLERRSDGLFYNTILPFHRTNVVTTGQNMGLVKYAQSCYILDHSISRLQLTYQSLEG